MESQSQSQAGGQAQSRGAAGLTRYHRPLALSVEVSASSLLHLPSPVGLSRNWTLPLNRVFFVCLFLASSIKKLVLGSLLW